MGFLIQSGRMEIWCDEEQIEAAQILGGLALIVVSRGDLVAMGIGAAVAVEAVIEEPVLKLIKIAREPIRRVVGTIRARGRTKGMDFSGKV
jgi:hypothetical protein